MTTPSTKVKVNVDAASARVLGPDALRIDELALPRLHVSKKIGNDLVLLVAHAASKMRHALVRLLRIAQIRLRYQDVAHRQHAQATELLGRVKDDGREARRHLRVQSYFNSRLDLVLALDLRASEVNMSRRWRRACDEARIHTKHQGERASTDKILSCGHVDAVDAT